MFFYRVRGIVFALSALVAAAFCCIAVRVTNVDKLGAYVGTHTYYLDSTSSQALMKTRLNGLECLRVKGESVRIEGKADAAFVERVLQEQGASVRFVEETCDVTSYYAYTPQWQESVYIMGERVNLHIAVGEDACVIGYPIIFGGY